MNTIKGQMIAVLPVVEGQSERGEWQRGGFVLQYGEERIRTAAFTVFGREKVEKVRALRPGQAVEVRYAPESREYNGRWYTDLMAVGFEPIGAAQPAQPTAPAQVPTDSDLPF